MCASLPYIWYFYGVRIRDFDLGVVDCMTAQVGCCL
jgi:hypothetical protein